MLVSLCLHQLYASICLSLSMPTSFFKVSLLYFSLFQENVSLICMSLFQWHHVSLSMALSLSMCLLIVSNSVWPYLGLCLSVLSFRSSDSCLLNVFDHPFILFGFSSLSIFSFFLSFFNVRVYFFCFAGKCGCVSLFFLSVFYSLLFFYKLFFSLKSQVNTLCVSIFLWCAFLWVSKIE